MTSAIIASVNTRDTFDTRTGAFDPDADPTAINGCIRNLLNSFEESAYVGYTATPFANIFIYKEAETEEHGEDLFPRSFLVSLKEPSNYIGAAKVFRLKRRCCKKHRSGRTVPDCQDRRRRRHLDTEQPQERVPRTGDAAGVAAASTAQLCSRMRGPCRPGTVN